MQKTECFLLNLKELYPNLKKPSSALFREWQKLLSPLSTERIVSTLKLWVKENPTTPPSPKTFLSPPAQIKSPPRPQGLPFSPEAYLFEQDIKKNRNIHLYSTYCKAVRYILNYRLKQYYPKEEFKNFNFSDRYERAVERGLFADFAEVLELVHNSGENYD